MLAAVLELETAAGRQVLHRGGDEDLARTSEPTDPGPDVDRQSRRLAVDGLHLAGVDAGADLKVERADRIDDLLRTSDRSSRPVEGREEAVAGRVDLASPVASEQPADRPVVALQQLVPRSVSELESLPCRADDVGEQDRGEDTVKLSLLFPEPFDEALGSSIKTAPAIC